MPLDGDESDHTAQPEELDLLYDEKGELHPWLFAETDTNGNTVIYQKSAPPASFKPTTRGIPGGIKSSKKGDQALQKELNETRDPGGREKIVLGAENRIVASSDPVGTSVAPEEQSRKKPGWSRNTGPPPWKQTDEAKVNMDNIAARGGPTKKQVEEARTRRLELKFGEQTRRLQKWWRNVVARRAFMNTRSQKFKDRLAQQEKLDEENARREAERKEQERKRALAMADEDAVYKKRVRAASKIQANFRGKKQRAQVKKKKMELEAMLKSGPTVLQNAYDKVDTVQLGWLLRPTAKSIRQRRDQIQEWVKKTHAHAMRLSKTEAELARQKQLSEKHPALLTDSMQPVGHSSAAAPSGTEPKVHEMDRRLRQLEARPHDIFKAIQRMGQLEHRVKEDAVRAMETMKRLEQESSAPADVLKRRLQQVEQELQASVDTLEIARNMDKKRLDALESIVLEALEAARTSAAADAEIDEMARVNRRHIVVEGGKQYAASRKKGLRQPEPVTLETVAKAREEAEASDPFSKLRAVNLPGYAKSQSTRNAGGTGPGAAGTTSDAKKNAIHLTAGPNSVLYKLPGQQAAEQAAMAQPEPKYLAPAGPIEPFPLQPLPKRPFHEGHLETADEDQNVVHTNEYLRAGGQTHPGQATRITKLDPGHVQMHSTSPTRESNFQQQQIKFNRDESAAMRAQQQGRMQPRESRPSPTSEAFERHYGSRQKPTYSNKIAKPEGERNFGRGGPGIAPPVVEEQFEEGVDLLDEHFGLNHLAYMALPKPAEEDIDLVQEPEVDPTTGMEVMRTRTPEHYLNKKAKQDAQKRRVSIKEIEEIAEQETDNRPLVENADDLMRSNRSVPSQTSTSKRPWETLDVVIPTMPPPQLFIPARQQGPSAYAFGTTPMKAGGQASYGGYATQTNDIFDANGQPISFYVGPQSAMSSAASTATEVMMRPKVMQTADEMREFWGFSANALSPQLLGPNRDLVHGTYAGHLGLEGTQYPPPKTAASSKMSQSMAGDDEEVKSSTSEHQMPHTQFLLAMQEELEKRYEEHLGAQKQKAGLHRAEVPEDDDGGSCGLDEGSTSDPDAYKSCAEADALEYYAGAGATEYLELFYDSSCDEEEIMEEREPGFDENFDTRPLSRPSTTTSCFFDGEHSATNDDEPGASSTSAAAKPENTNTTTPSGRQLPPGPLTAPKDLVQPAFYLTPDARLGQLPYSSIDGPIQEALRKQHHVHVHSASSAFGSFHESGLYTDSAGQMINSARQNSRASAFGFLSPTSGSRRPKLHTNAVAEALASPVSVAEKLGLAPVPNLLGGSIGTNPLAIDTSKYRKPVIQLDPLDQQRKDMTESRYQVELMLQQHARDLAMVTQTNTDLRLNNMSSLQKITTSSPLTGARALAATGSLTSPVVPATAMTTNLLYNNTRVGSTSRAKAAVQSGLPLPPSAMQQVMARPLSNSNLHNNFNAGSLVTSPNQFLRNTTNMVLGSSVQDPNASLLESGVLEEADLEASIEHKFKEKTARLESAAAAQLDLQLNAIESQLDALQKRMEKHKERGQEAGKQEQHAREKLHSSEILSSIGLTATEMNSNVPAGAADDLSILSSEEAVVNRAKNATSMVNAKENVRHNPLFAHVSSNAEKQDEAREREIRQKLHALEVRKSERDLEQRTRREQMVAELALVRKQRLEREKRAEVQLEKLDAEEQREELDMVNLETEVESQKQLRESHAKRLKNKKEIDYTASDWNFLQTVNQANARDREHLQVAKQRMAGRIKQIQKHRDSVQADNMKRKNDEDKREAEIEAAQKRLLDVYKSVEADDGRARDSLNTELQKVEQKRELREAKQAEIARSQLVEESEKLALARAKQLELKLEEEKWGRIRQEHEKAAKLGEREQFELEQKKLMVHAQLQIVKNGGVVLQDEALRGFLDVADAPLERAAKMRELRQLEEATEQILREKQATGDLLQAEANLLQKKVEDARTERLQLEMDRANFAKEKAQYDLARVVGSGPLTGLSGSPASAHMLPEMSHLHSQLLEAQKVNVELEKRLRMWATPYLGIGTPGYQSLTNSTSGANMYNLYNRTGIPLSSSFVQGGGTTAVGAVAPGSSNTQPPGSPLFSLANNSINSPTFMAANLVWDMDKSSASLMQKAVLAAEKMQELQKNLKQLEEGHTVEVARLWSRKEDEINAIDRSYRERLLDKPQRRVIFDADAGRKLDQVERHFESEKLKLDFALQAKVASLRIELAKQKAAGKGYEATAEFAKKVEELQGKLNVSTSNCNTKIKNFELVFREQCQKIDEELTKQLADQQAAAASNSSLQTTSSMLAVLEANAANKKREMEHMLLEQKRQLEQEMRESNRELQKDLAEQKAQVNAHLAAIPHLERIAILEAQSAAAAEEYKAQVQRLTREVELAHKQVKEDVTRKIELDPAQRSLLEAMAARQDEQLEQRLQLEKQKLDLILERRTSELQHELQQHQHATEMHMASAQADAQISQVQLKLEAAEQDHGKRVLELEKDLKEAHKLLEEECRKRTEQEPLERQKLQQELADKKAQLDRDHETEKAKLVVMHMSLKADMAAEIAKHRAVAEKEKHLSIAAHSDKISDLQKQLELAKQEHAKQLDKVFRESKDEQKKIEDEYKKKIASEPAKRLQLEQEMQHKLDHLQQQADVAKSHLQASQEATQAQLEATLAREKQERNEKEAQAERAEIERSSKEMLSLKMRHAEEEHKAECLQLEREMAIAQRKLEEEYGRHADAEGKMDEEWKKEMKRQKDILEQHMVADKKKLDARLKAQQQNLQTENAREQALAIAKEKERAAEHEEQVREAAFSEAKQEAQKDYQAKLQRLAAEKAAAFAKLEEEHKARVASEGNLKQEHIDEMAKQKAKLDAEMAEREAELKRSLDVKNAKLEETHTKEKAEIDARIRSEQLLVEAEVQKHEQEEALRRLDAEHAAAEAKAKRELQAKMHQMEVEYQSKIATADASKQAELKAQLEKQEKQMENGFKEQQMQLKKNLDGERRAMQREYARARSDAQEAEAAEEQSHQAEVEKARLEARLTAIQAEYEGQKQKLLSEAKRDKEKANSDYAARINLAVTQQEKDKLKLELDERLKQIDARTQIAVQGLDDKNRTQREDLMRESHARMEATNARVAEEAKRRAVKEAQEVLEQQKKEVKQSHESEKKRLKDEADQKRQQTIEFYNKKMTQDGVDRAKAEEELAKELKRQEQEADELLHKQELFFSDSQAKIQQEHLQDRAQAVERAAADARKKADEKARLELDSKIRQEKEKFDTFSKEAELRNEKEKQQLQAEYAAKIEQEAHKREEHERELERKKLDLEKSIALEKQKAEEKMKSNQRGLEREQARTQAALAEKETAERHVRDVEASKLALEEQMRAARSQHGIEEKKLLDDAEKSQKEMEQQFKKRLAAGQASEAELEREKIALQRRVKEQQEDMRAELRKQHDDMEAEHKKELAEKERKAAEEAKQVAAKEAKRALDEQMRRANTQHQEELAKIQAEAEQAKRLAQDEHERAMAFAEASGQDKTQLEKQWLDRKKDLEEKLKAEKDSLHAQLADERAKLESEHEADLKALDAAEQARKQIEREKEEMEQNMRKAAIQHEQEEKRLHQEAEEAKRQIEEEAKKRELDKTKTAEQHATELAQQRRELEQRLQREKSELAAKVREEQDKLRKDQEKRQEERTRQLEQEKQRLMEQAANAKSKQAEEIDKLTQRVSDLQLDLMREQQSLVDKEEEFSQKLKQEHEQKEKDLARLQQDLHDSHSSQKASMAADHATNISDYDLKLEQLKQQARDREAELEKKLVLAQEQQRALELATIRKVDEAKKSQEEEMRRLFAEELQSEKLRMSQNLDSRVSQVMAEHQAQIEKMQAEFGTRMKAEQDTHAEEHGKLKEEADAAHKELEDEFRGKIEAEKHRQAEHEEEWARQRALLDEQVAHERNLLDAKLKDMEKQLQMQIEANNARDRLQEIDDHTKDGIDAGMQKLTEKHEEAMQQVITRTNLKFAQLKQTHEKQMKEMKQEQMQHLNDPTMSAQLELKKMKLEDTQEEERKGLEQDKAKQLAELQQKFLTDQDKLRKEHEVAARLAHQTAEEHRTVQEKDANSKHRQEQEELLKKFEEEKAQLAAAHQVKLAKTTSKEDKQKIQQAYETSVTDLEQVLRANQADLEQALIAKKEKLKKDVQKVKKAAASAAVRALIRVKPARKVDVNDAPVAMRTTSQANQGAVKATMVTPGRAQKELITNLFDEQNQRLREFEAQERNESKRLLEEMFREQNERLQSHLAETTAIQQQSVTEQNLQELLNQQTSEASDLRTKLEQLQSEKEKLEDKLKSREQLTKMKALELEDQLKLFENKLQLEKQARAAEGQQRAQLLADKDRAFESLLAEHTELKTSKEAADARRANEDDALRAETQAQLEERLREEENQKFQELMANQENMTAEELEKFALEMSERENAHLSRAEQLEKAHEKAQQLMQQQRDYQRKARERLLAQSANLAGMFAAGDDDDATAEERRMMQATLAQRMMEAMRTMQEQMLDLQEEHDDEIARQNQALEVLRSTLEEDRQKFEEKQLEMDAEHERTRDQLNAIAAERDLAEKRSQELQEFVYFGSDQPAEFGPPAAAMASQQTVIAQPIIGAMLAEEENVGEYKAYLDSEKERLEQEKREHELERQRYDEKVFQDRVKFAETAEQMERERKDHNDRMQEEKNRISNDYQTLQQQMAIYGSSLNEKLKEVAKQGTTITDPNTGEKFTLEHVEEIKREQQILRQARLEDQMRLEELKNQRDEAFEKHLSEKDAHREIIAQLAQERDALEDQLNSTKLELESQARAAKDPDAGKSLFGGMSLPTTGGVSVSLPGAGNMPSIDVSNPFGSAGGAAGDAASTTAANNKPAEEDKDYAIILKHTRETKQRAVARLDAYNAKVAELKKNEAKMSESEKQKARKDLEKMAKDDEAKSREELDALLKERRVIELRKAAADRRTTGQADVATAKSSKEQIAAQNKLSEVEMRKRALLEDHFHDHGATAVNSNLAAEYANLHRKSQKLATKARPGGSSAATKPLYYQERELLSARIISNKLDQIAKGESVLSRNNYFDFSSPNIGVVRNNHGAVLSSGAGIFGPEEIPGSFAQHQNINYMTARTAGQEDEDEEEPPVEQPPPLPQPTLFGLMMRQEAQRQRSMSPNRM